MANPAIVVNLAQGNQANAGNNNALNLNVRKVISGTLLVASITISLVALAHNQAKSVTLSKSPSFAEEAIYTGLTKAVKFPHICAGALAATAFIPELFKGAVLAAKAAKFCIYDKPIIGTGILSSAVTAAGMKYGPELAATYFPKFFEMITKTPPTA